MTTEKAKRKQVRHIVYYDSYWRCDVKECGKCRVVRPVTEFYTSKHVPCGYTKTCKSCYRHDNLTMTPERRARRYKVQQAWAKKNKGRIKASQRRHLDKYRDLINQRRKLSSIRKEVERGESYASMASRTRRGRMRIFALTIRRTYGFPCTTEDCSRQFMRSNDFNRVFRAWKRAGFVRRLGPNVLPRVAGKPIKCLGDFKVVEYGKIRSRAVKAAWKRGTYNTVTYKDSRRKPGSGFAGGPGFGRGRGVRGNQATAPVA